MNIVKIVRNNILHLIIIALLVALIVMTKQQQEGFMSDNVKNTLGFVGIILVVFVIGATMSILGGGA